jgi:uncharacterized protein (TIGR02271 family)
MTSRKILAVFNDRAAAESARNSLLQLGLSAERITITDQGASDRAVQRPEGHGSFWAHIKDMFMPDRDRHTYQESMRRGGCLLAATVEDANADDAIARIEQAGPIDLDQHEAQWRSDGWNPTPETSTPPDVAVGSNTTDAAEQQRIPVVEERLRVGKREVNRGSVRVRSYIVEEPVHEEVRLREEHVDVQRRPVDAPTRPVVRGSPEDLLQERTLEVSETAEQAVVAKEARVTEEVVVAKSTDERTERIDDTVRRTKVDVEDNRRPKGNAP